MKHLTTTIKAIMIAIAVVITASFFSTTANATEQKVYTADHIKDEEARQIYQNILDTTKDILKDEDVYYRCDTKFVPTMYNAYKSALDENMTNEEYEALDPYEVFLEYGLYLCIQSSQNTYANNGKSYPALKSENDLISNWARKSMIEELNNEKNREVYRAMREAISYQYRYFQSNGCFYDFFRGANYMELMGMDKTSDYKPEGETVVEAPAKEESASIEATNTDTGIATDKAPEHPITQSVPETSSNNTILYIIIAALALVIVFLVIKKKK